MHKKKWISIEKKTQQQQREEVVGHKPMLYPITKRKKAFKDTQQVGWMENEEKKATPSTGNYLFIEK